MVPLRIVTVALLLVLVVPQPFHGRAFSGAPADDTAQSLFAQSAAQALARESPNRQSQDPDTSFLLFDVRSGKLLASRWDLPDTPIPLGSLVKPFVALAFGEHNHFVYPVHVCRGTGSGCWRPRGHGSIDLTSAIAYSCNSYFRALTQTLTAADVSATAQRFSLDAPTPGIPGAALAGFGSQWRISPLRMARAYLELVSERNRPGVTQILRGMEESARSGTGEEVDRALSFSDALVKTGTAACTHFPHAPGDGFAVVLLPADAPKMLLMVRVHGVPGAQAAKKAGEMLRRIGD